jgi:hypothetical protein
VAVSSASSVKRYDLEPQTEAHAELKVVNSLDRSKNGVGEDAPL